MDKHYWPEIAYHEAKRDEFIAQVRIAQDILNQYQPSILFNDGVTFKDDPECVAWLDEANRRMKERLDE